MPRQTLKQRADGRYRCKYNGMYFYGATQGEALAAREAYKRAEAMGERLEQAGVTCRAYASRWLPVYKGHLTPRAYDANARVLERFCALYGDKPIKDISATDIQVFLNGYNGRSFSSINKAKAVIKGLFKSALSDCVITRDPCINLITPAGRKGTHRAIDYKERQLIHETQHKLRAAAMAMLYAGLRRGEAMALDIDRDVDFSKKEITIREAVRFNLQGLPEIADPKTEAGARKIPLLDILADELRGKHGLLMQSASGTIMTECAFNRSWESYMNALMVSLNGCQKRWYGKKKSSFDRGPLPLWRNVNIRPHDLRHSYCTMLYEHNVDIKTAMKWMGHADQSTTLKIYTHLTQEREKEALAALTEGLNNALRGQNGGQMELGFQKTIIK